jgi:putative ABC transport system ATP-binding protein
MIKLANINKVFTTLDVETTALNNINLVIEPGEFISVMGPSGCGKSTLLNLLGMLDSPASGSYLFNDEQIADYSEKKLALLRKQYIGFIFQSFNLIDELSVYNNVELPLLYQRISAKERKQRVNEVLERVNLGHRAEHLPLQLSGGQQQRVAVARALVINPQLILADEPTGNLDSQNGEEVMELLTELNGQGTTIIMVTHSPEHAKYADRIVRLFDGAIISKVPKQQNQPQGQNQGECA